MEAYMASVILFAGNFAPREWAECNGQIMQVNENTALFSLIGTTYGGDGMRTFALPKLKSPVEGMRYIICIHGIYPSRP